MKPVLFIIAIMVFRFNYDFCTFIHGDDLTPWWKLRLNIYAVLMFALFGLAKLKTKPQHERIMSALLVVAGGLCGNDVVDRIWFDINTYQSNDLIAEILTGALALAHYKYHNFLCRKKMLKF